MSMKRLRDIVSPRKETQQKRSNSQKTPSKSIKNSADTPTTSRTTLSRKSLLPGTSSRTELSIENPMDSATFTKFFKDALKDEETTKQMKEILGPQISENTANIAGLIKVIKNQNDKIEKLESEVEYLKQQTRKKSLIVSGLDLQKDDDLEQSLMKLCKEKLKINLHPMDVDSVSKLRKRTGNNDRKPDILLTLTTHKKKIEIMREKKKLKQLDSVVYINEHLTPSQGEIFAEARARLKKKTLCATWTRDGLTFVKVQEGDQPTPVKTMDKLNAITKKDIN